MNRSITFIAIISIIAIITGGAIILEIVSLKNPETVTITVMDKGIKRVSQDADVYLIYTDKGTFKIEDSFFLRRYSSSDEYGRMQIGKKYRIEVRGYRIPVLSMYKNITRTSLIR